jgi:hypothetical protein
VVYDYSLDVSLQPDGGGLYWAKAIVAHHPHSGPWPSPPLIDTHVVIWHDK